MIADLEIPDSDKDTSKSCVFGYPDRPADTLPPGPFPIDPPGCFPYCPPDDWPPDPLPDPIIPPGIIPPGIDPIDFGIIASLDFAPLSRYIIYHVFPGREGLLSAQSFPTVNVSIELQGDGIDLIPESAILNNTTPNTTVEDFLGAGGISGDYVFKTESFNILDAQNKGYAKRVTATPSFLDKLIFLYPSVNLFRIKLENSDSGVISGPIGGDANIVNTDAEILHRIDLDDFTFLIQNDPVGYNVPFVGFTLFIWYYKPTGHVYVDSIVHDVVDNTSPHIVAVEL